MSNVYIRGPIKNIDHEWLYQHALMAPELQCSATDPFMTSDEFLWAMQEGIFLVAGTALERPVGFLYASTSDIERSPLAKVGCLVYLFVLPAHRRQGVAAKLLEAGLVRLRAAGCQSVYGWAKSDGGILKMMKQAGFAIGKQYTWVDMQLR